MEKVIDGITYESFESNGCAECVAKPGTELCDQLLRSAGRLGLQWKKKEVSMSNKTAREMLVDLKLRLLLGDDAIGLVVDLNETIATLDRESGWRPIAELPKELNDGEQVMFKNATGSSVYVRIPYNVYCGSYTHFYIIPAPPIERKLHECYMPGCRSDKVRVNTATKYFYCYCVKCGATGPEKASWQAAKEAWGYEDAPN